MEGEGISKFWKMKAMTKRPAARMAQMEDSASSGVSAGSVTAVEAGGLVDGCGAGLLVDPPAEFNLLEVLNAVRLLGFQTMASV
jgi:hypothetical protein